MRRRASCAALLVWIGLVAGAPTPATADSGKRRLCADKVAVWDSPSGFVIAYLYRPQKLKVLGTAHKRRWSLVRFDSGPRGWIPTSKICP